jgi:hypothetical protein
MDIECAAAPAAAATAPQKSTARRWGLAAAVLATAALAVSAVAALTTQQRQQSAKLAVESRSLEWLAPGSLASGRNRRVQIGVSSTRSVKMTSDLMGGAKYDYVLMYQPIQSVDANYFQWVVQVSIAALSFALHCSFAHCSHFVLVRCKASVSLHLALTALLLSMHSTVTHQQQPYITAGLKPMIVLTAHGYNLDQINGGALDGDLNRIAGLAAGKGEIWFRPLHEANSNWYTWGIYNGNNNADKFRQAFSRMSNMLTRNHSSGNVHVQLGLNNKSPNDMNKNVNKPFAPYMPDRGTYDHACVSAYNWGDDKSGGYKQFADVFIYAYNNLAEVTDAPLGLCEGSTVGRGGNKGQWFQNAIGTLQSLPRVTQAHWFLINVNVSSTLYLNILHVVVRDCCSLLATLLLCMHS